MKNKIFIIPGNPSVHHYYKLWSQKLSEKTSMQVEVLHHIQIKDTHNSLSSYQESFEKNILERIEDGYNYTIIGHSIGGFFARELYLKNPNIFNKLILVFPYFGDENLKGRMILNLTKFLEKRPLIKNKSLKFLLKLNNYCKALDNITYSELNNGIKLGYLEKNFFHETQYKFTPCQVSDPRTDFLYTQKDNWCTKKTISKIENSQISFYEVNSVHDFVLQEDEIELVNDKLKELLSLNKRL